MKMLYQGIWGLSCHLQEFQERRQVPKVFQNSIHIQTRSRTHCWIQQFFENPIFRNSNIILFSADCFRNWTQISLFLPWGVLSFQFLQKKKKMLVVIICFGKSPWQVLVHCQHPCPIPCPAPTLSSKEALMRLHLYPRLFSSLFSVIKRSFFSSQIFYNSIDDQF